VGRVKTGKADRPRRAGAGLALFVCNVVACVWLAGCAVQRAEDRGLKTEDMQSKNVLSDDKKSESPSAISRTQNELENKKKPAQEYTPSRPDSDFYGTIPAEDYLHLVKEGMRRSWNNGDASQYDDYHLRIRLEFKYDTTIPDKRVIQINRIYFMGPLIGSELSQDVTTQIIKYLEARGFFKIVVRDSPDNIKVEITDDASFKKYLWRRYNPTFPHALDIGFFKFARNPFIESSFTELPPSGACPSDDLVAFIYDMRIEPVEGVFHDLVSKRKLASIYECRLPSFRTYHGEGIPPKHVILTKIQ